MLPLLSFLVAVVFTGVNTSRDYPWFASVVAFILSHREVLAMAFIGLVLLWVGGLVLRFLLTLGAILRVLFVVSRTALKFVFFLLLLVAEFTRLILVSTLRFFVPYV